MTMLTVDTCSLERLLDPFWPPPLTKEENGVSTLEIEIPGVKKDQVNVSIEGRLLAIKSKGRTQIDKSYRLAAFVDTDAIEASLEDGLLTVKLPRHERAKARTIQVG